MNVDPRFSGVKRNGAFRKRRLLPESGGLRHFDLPQAHIGEILMSPCQTVWRGRLPHMSDFLPLIMDQIQRRLKAIGYGEAQRERLQRYRPLVDRLIEAHSQGPNPKFEKITRLFN